jgi:hypothetical protein
MTAWTEESLVAAYPTYFKEYRGDVRKSCLAFGLEIEAGWLSIVADLCEEIKTTNPPDQFTFEQVKEKFGTLRIYCSGSNGDINELIAKAENRSAKICEMCGTDQGVTCEGKYWIKTLCPTCREEREARKKASLNE